MKGRGDLIVLVIGGLLALLGLARLGMAFAGSGLPASADGLALRTGAYEASAPRLPAPTLAEWVEPPAQSGGEDWIFEVFTPPIIYFNPETLAFTLTPPVPRAEKPAFGLEVVGLERELYRLQYAGHVGEDGRYLIEVREHPAGIYHRGRVGQAFPEADFEIVSFVAERRLVEPENPGETPYVERRVLLEIRDERLGEVIPLTAEPRYGTRPIVTLQTPETAASRRFPGENLTVGEAVFTVLSADLVTGQVVIEKTRSDATSSEIETFFLPVPSAPASSAP